MGKKQRLKYQKVAQASSSSHPAAEASSLLATASPVLDWDWRVENSKMSN
ncbi:hypothetical protein COLO4_29716 [Corchorus olitorius]|uniref:Uncharacterized protein n=1 Tax=Corchorus olitorius TaxID=93759 RepID=A0A1R3HDF2_9ROSI|nr:hypothetical protein COLO4_29716 [Corchorus olitorius]